MEQVLEFLRNYGPVFNRFGILGDPYSGCPADGDPMFCFLTPVLLTYVAAGTRHTWDHIKDLEPSISLDDVFHIYFPHMIPERNGVYACQLDGDTEGHGFILVVKDRTVTYIGTYGGAKQYSLHTWTKNEFVRIYASATSPVKSIEGAKDYYTIMDPNQVPAMDSNYVNQKILHVTARIIPNIDSLNLDMFRSYIISRVEDGVEHYEGIEQDYDTLRVALA